MLDTEALPRFACPDWWERIKAGQTPMADVPLNQEKAAKALAFFNRLKLPDVPGNPPLSQACGEWFREILCAFLASEDPETKQRLVWELLCMVPKKNSKTTYVAALGLTALFMEEAPNRQMLIVAPSQNISERCFEQAQGMIRLDVRLDAIFKVQDHLKCIERRKTGTQLNVKTFDTSIVTGEIPILTIIDELHELGKKKGAAAVMQQIRGGGITMQGGQVLMITTQSDEQPAGIWKTELDKARKIRDGKGGASPILLPVLYEFPFEKQRDQAFWRDQRHWRYLLPNIGRSIDPQRLIADYENNGRVTQEAEQIWLSQHLNIEIGVGFGDDGWRGADYWEERADPSLTLESLIERSEVAVVGADGGGLDDLFGVCVIGREKITRRWLVWTHAFAHPKVLQVRKEIAPRLLDFEAEGSLTICEVSAYIARIADIVWQVWNAGLLPEKNAVGFDPNNIAAFVDALALKRIEGPMLHRLRQGPALSPALWGLEHKLSDDTISHDGSSMMAWSVGNVKIEVKGNGNMATKQAAGRTKIDPVIAMLCAAILMSWNPEATGVLDLSDYLKSPVMHA
ncbi:MULTISPECIES: terminase TerL endonuclease subunit [unclassified Mesorhizobium]|uniref:terminase TerL endonuclease subunit n=1 Tax=unclassified Mesorhizobium TaxID=325217 RepID=UPI00112A6D22|nr:MULTISPECIES: terminase TerL endonuclease subunit [unclassified Mesorhizobium]MCA0025483.1 terminase large subunit [Mesorhizobium sp. B263B1A]TPJ97129.1 terminase large subunit [Mesorhizobium sp. B2-5-12]TPK27204.1 terminase large subunit [Mesorhizobium sp. B2-5-6]